MPSITNPFKENPKKALKEDIKLAAKSYFSTFNEQWKNSLITKINNAINEDEDDNDAKNKLKEYEIVEVLQAALSDNFEQFISNKKNDPFKNRRKPQIVRDATNINFGFNDNEESRSVVAENEDEEENDAENIIKQAIELEEIKYRKKQNEETEKLRSSLEKLVEKTKKGKLGDHSGYIVKQENEGKKTIFEIVDSKAKDLAPKYSVIIFEDGALTQGYLNKGQEVVDENNSELSKELADMEENNQNPYEEENQEEEEIISQNRTGTRIGEDQTLNFVELGQINVNLNLNTIQVTKQDLKEISLGKNGESSIEGYKKLIEEIKLHREEVKKQNVAAEPLKKLFEEMYNKGKEVEGQGYREFSRLYVLDQNGEINENLGTDTYQIKKTEPSSENGNATSYFIERIRYVDDGNPEKKSSKIVFQPNRKTRGYFDQITRDDEGEIDGADLEDLTQATKDQVINEFKPIVDKKRTSSIEFQEKLPLIKILTKNLEELVEIYGTDQNHPQRKKLENLPTGIEGEVVEGTYSYEVTKTAPNKNNGEKTTYNIKRIHKAGNGNEIEDTIYYKLELQKGQKAKGFFESVDQNEASEELTNQQVVELSNFVTGIKNTKDADKAVSIAKKQELKNKLTELLDGENSKIITIDKTDGKFITYKITKDRFFDKYELEKIDRDNDPNQANIAYTSLDFSGERIKGYLSKNPKPTNYDYVNKDEVSGYQNLLNEFKTAAVRSNLQNLVKDGESKTIRINDNDANNSVIISRGTDEIGKKRRVFKALEDVVGVGNIDNALTVNNNGLLFNPVGGNNYNDLEAAKTAVLALDENSPDYSQDQKENIIKRKTAFNALVDLYSDQNIDLPNSELVSQRLRIGIIQQQESTLTEIRAALNQITSEEFYVLDPSVNDVRSHSKFKFKNEENVSKLTGYFLDLDNENDDLDEVAENNPNPNGILDTLFVRTSYYLEDSKKEAKSNKSAADSFKKTLEDLYLKNAELKYLPITTDEGNNFSLDIRNINAGAGTDSYEITRNENEGETTFKIIKTYRNENREFRDNETRYSIYRFDADGKVRGFRDSQVNPDNFVEAAKLMKDLEPEEVKILGLKSKKITDDNIEKIIHQREIAIEQKKATKELKDALETQLGKYNSNNTSLQNLPISNDDGVIDPSKGTDSYVISKDENQGITNYQIRKTHKLGAVETVTHSKYQFDSSGGVRFFENNDNNNDNQLETLAVEANDKNLTLNEKKIDQNVVSNVKNITEKRSNSLSSKAKTVGKKAILAPTKTIEEVIRDNIVEIALMRNDPGDGNLAHDDARSIIDVLQNEERSKKLADDLMKAGYKKLNEDEIGNAIKSTELVSLINVKRTEAGLNGNNLAADSLNDINNNNVLSIAVSNYIKTPDAIKKIVEEGTAFKTKLLNQEEGFRTNIRAEGLVARKEDLIKALVDADLTPNKAQIIASIDKITDEANFSVVGKRERVTNSIVINGDNNNQIGLAQGIANALPLLKEVKNAAKTFADNNGVGVGNANDIATQINTALNNPNPITSDQIAMAVVSGLKGLVNINEFNNKRDEAVNSLGLGLGDADRENAIKAIWNKAQYQLEQDPKNWLVEGGVEKNSGKIANKIFGGTKIEIVGAEVLNTQKTAENIIRDYVKEIVHSLSLDATAQEIADALKRGKAQGVEYVTGNPIDKLTTALVKNGHWEKEGKISTKLSDDASNALAGDAVAAIVNEIRPDIDPGDFNTDGSLANLIGNSNANGSLAKMVQDNVEKTYRWKTMAGKAETMGEIAAGAVALGVGVPLIIGGGVIASVGTGGYLGGKKIYDSGVLGQVGGGLSSAASATYDFAKDKGAIALDGVAFAGGKIQEGATSLYESAKESLNKEPEETSETKTEPKKLSQKQIQERKNKQNYAVILRTEIEEKLSALNRLASFSHNSTTFSVKEKDGEHKVTYKKETKGDKVEYLITKTNECNNETYSKLVFSQNSGQYLGGYKDKNTSEKQDNDITADQIKNLSTELYAFHHKEVFNYNKNSDAKKIELSPYAIKKSLEFKLYPTDSKEYSFTENGEENKLKIERQIDENLGRVKYLITKEIGDDKALFTVLSFDKETEKFIGGFKDKEKRTGQIDRDFNQSFKNIISEINNFEKKSAEQEKSNPKAKENPVVLNKRKPNLVEEDFVAESSEVKRKKSNFGDRNVRNRDLSEENVVNQTQTNEISEKRKINLKEWTGGEIKDNDRKESYKFIESNLNKEVKEVSFHKSGFAKTDLSKIIENGAKFRTCVFAKGCDLGDLTKLDPNNFTACRFHESLLESLKGNKLEEFKKKFDITGEANEKGYYTAKMPGNSVESPEASQLRNARFNSRSS